MQVYRSIALISIAKKREMLFSISQIDIY